MTHIRRFALALAVALTAAAPGCARPPAAVVVHTGADPQPRTLSASGTATISVRPDCADLTMTLDVKAARPGDAMTEVRARQARLVSALERRGVAAGDLQLSQLGVDPVYRYEDSRSVLDGFSAHVTLMVTTHDFDQIAALMQTGADDGVTSMSSRFRRSDLDALRKQVRDQALVAAQAKAAETAGVLGIALGQLTGVSDAAQGYLSTNEYFPSAGSGGGGDLAGEVQPLTVDVTLTYAI